MQRFDWSTETTAHLSDIVGRGVGVIEEPLEEGTSGPVPPLTRRVRGLSPLRLRHQIHSVLPFDRRALRRRVAWGNTNVSCMYSILANLGWTTPVRIVNKIHKICTKSLQFTFYLVVHNFFNIFSTIYY